MRLRDQLVQLALEWQMRFGIAPRITDAISEFDAAQTIGMTETEYADSMKNRTAVSKGYDFLFNGVRYQVKANRPSGKRGSKVSVTAKPKNYDWDILIWILYDTQFQIEEIWEWKSEDYRRAFEFKKNVRPQDMRKGNRREQVSKC